MGTPQPGKRNIPAAVCRDLSGHIEFGFCYTMDTHDKKVPIREIFEQNCACFHAHPVMVDNGPHRFTNIY